MNINFNSETQSILKDIFVFSGLLSPDGYLLDLQGQIFSESGTAPELLIGHKFSETVFWQFQEHTSKILQKAIDEAAQGIKAQIQLNFRVAAQKVLNVELSLNPVYGELGSVKEIVFYAFDVTKYQREIEYHKARGEHLLYAAEAADIGLWFWDLAKDEIFSTPKCSEFYGLPPQEIITSDSFIKTLHPEDGERIIKAFQEAQVNRSEYNLEFRIIHSDESIQWLNLTGKTFFDAEQNPVSMMGVVRKITERKLALDELARVNESVRKARDEAEEANRAKDYFLAIVSHELRSPLNAILGWAKILLTKEIDEKVRRNALETIERSAKSQAKLIEDLVDSARIASGKLRLELRPVSLYEVVRNAFDSQKPVAAAKNIQFDLETNTEQAEIYGDSMRLQQVFTNLITNALKFTPEGGRVKIKFESNIYLATVSVEDNGQGISPESLPTIFKQFAQADEKVSRDKSGLGLGLAIVKTLVEKHGGSIKAESAGTERGAKFSVTLPLLAVTANNSANHNEKSVKTVENLLLDGIKILVVEDDEDSREVLQIFLEQSGATVESAESAAVAWKLLTESNDEIPDIIVSDLAMPVEDGYSFISKVRHVSREEIKEIPAMALSAFAAPENKEKAYACGFQLYHTKPFEPDGIVKDILLLVKKDGITQN
ncbi:MAG: PAS domain-containing hybrid sensor histidine kinase/response regulator [Pyrinomonadaceae bacterium]